MKGIMLVTGATDGIGKATALELAKRGAYVIIHGRNLQKVQQTIAEIHHQVPNAQLDYAVADFSSLSEVSALAEDLLARFSTLNVLIHNAGVYMKRRQLSADGYEMTFAVNHLAPFCLTQLLLPRLRESHARVITVASMVHANVPIDFNNLNAEKYFDGYKAYAQSKTANILFAKELAEREQGNLTSNSLHPGVIATKLLAAGFGLMGASPERGAVTSVYLATADEVANVTGKYFVDCQEKTAAPHATDPAVRKQLWKVSEEMIKSKLGAIWQA
jgi:NAD(P)-dependent dehydrogenase (short-subunit alcohol dehydrogenase family)